MLLSAATTVVPTQNTFIQAVIGRDRPITKDFTSGDAKYAGTGLTRFERVIYGSEALTARCLVETGDMLLGVTYAPHLGDQIEEGIENSRRDLRDELVKRRRLIANWGSELQFPPRASVFRLLASECTRAGVSAVLRYACGE